MPCSVCQWSGCSDGQGEWERLARVRLAVGSEGTEAACRPGPGADGQGSTAEEGHRQSRRGPGSGIPGHREASAKRGGEGSGQEREQTATSGSRGGSWAGSWPGALVPESRGRVGCRSLAWPAVGAWGPQDQLAWCGQTQAGLVSQREDGEGLGGQRLSRSPGGSLHSRAPAGPSLPPRLSRGSAASLQ